MPLEGRACTECNDRHCILVAKRNRRRYLSVVLHKDNTIRSKHWIRRFIAAMVIANGLRSAKAIAN
jgi:hypothetical protein